MRFINKKSIAAFFVALAVLPLSAHAQTGTMFVTGNKVGIGVDTPTELLHLQLATPGPELKMRLQQEAANAWAYSVVNSNPARPNAFRISKQGSGGPEVDIISQGDPAGASTMIVYGSIDATAFNVTSSRATKSEIQALDGRDVLAKLAELPVAEWHYTADSTSRRHIGPMAEDFKAAFDLGGSGKTISVVDANGVAFAAIQGLYAEVQDRDAKIEQLSGQVADLQEMVQQLVDQK